jgi:hypothetical protein
VVWIDGLLFGCCLLEVQESSLMTKAGGMKGVSLVARRIEDGGNHKEGRFTAITFAIAVCVKLL